MKQALSLSVCVSIQYRKSSITIKIDSLIKVGGGGEERLKGEGEGNNFCPLKRKGRLIRERESFKREGLEDLR